MWVLQNPWSAGKLSERSFPHCQRTGVLLQPPPTVSLPPHLQGCVPGQHQPAGMSSGTAGRCLLQGLLHTSRASPCHVNTPAHGRCHSSVLERQQHLPPWLLHVIPVYKPPSPSLHLTAAHWHLAHGCLSTKKENTVKAKPSPWMFVIIYVPVSPKRASTGLYTHQCPCPRVKAVSTKRSLGNTGRRGLWGALKGEPRFPISRLISCPIAPCPFSRVLTQIHKWNKHVLISKYEWHGFPWASCFLELFELETNQPVFTIDLFSKNLSSLK